jgi:hypothetical protein
MVSMVEQSGKSNLLCGFLEGNIVIVVSGLYSGYLDEFAQISLFTAPARYLNMATSH